MWLAFLFSISAFNNFHRQKFALSFATALVILGYLYSSNYFIFVDIGLLIILWIQRPTRILVGSVVALAISLFTFSLMPYSIVPAYLSFTHYFLSLALMASITEDSLIGAAILISVFNSQWAAVVIALYAVITGYQALKKADLLPKLHVR
ncbi:hypothetical protein [Coprothermobacter platensis]|uniref:hypothetical protein n=1 Tax=Coprothermobacter platensis TaxID=108819 RepID=UPI001FDFCED7|nr:hypothetical protein [Coprothermobacter platensis]